MGKKVHNSPKHQEQFVPPKPLFVESDTTGDARPPSLAFMARHYRSEYDLEKIKLYNNHAKETCYNLPLEDVTEYYSSTPLNPNESYTLRYNYNSGKVFFVDQADNEYSSLSYMNSNYYGILARSSQPKLSFNANEYKISDGNKIIIMRSNDKKILGPLLLTTGSAKKYPNQDGGNIYLPITFSVKGSN